MYALNGCVFETGDSERVTGQQYNVLVKMIYAESRGLA